MQIIKHIMVILGCHIHHIQLDRVTSGFNYAINHLNLNETYWFLTGGIKYESSHLRGTNTCSVDSQSEARQMLHQLNYSKNVVIDSDAKNTAENFVNLKRWLEFKKFNNTEIIITTSEFHKNRAELIFNGIFNNVTSKWNLAKLSCANCESDERIHIRNVNNDIRNALNL